MPKAKPIWFYPLSFEEVIDMLLKAPSKPKEDKMKKDKKVWGQVLFRVAAA